MIRYTGKTSSSFTGCDRAINFRYDQKVLVDNLANDQFGVSQYTFNVGDRIVRTDESSGNKIARVYDWRPEEREHSSLILRLMNLHSLMVETQM